MHINVFLQNNAYAGNIDTREKIICPAENMGPEGGNEKSMSLRLEEFWRDVYIDSNTFCFCFGVTELPEFTSYEKIKQFVDIVKDKDNIHLRFKNDYDMYEYEGADREIMWQDALQQMPQERIEFIFNNTLTVEKFKKIFPYSKVKFSNRFINRFFENVNEPYESTSKVRNKHFLCLNSRVTQHRDTIYNKLKNLNNSHMSYRLRNIFLDETNDWNTQQQKHFETNPLGDYAPDPQQFWQSCQDKISKNYYQDSYVYICTDSLFAGLGNPPAEKFYNVTHWWTEKLIKAFYYKLPVIQVGLPYSLASARSVGFKTFGAFWDESYDSETDPEKRMAMISDSIDTVSNMPIQELHNMYHSDDMQEILNHNFKTLFNLNDKYKSS
jgi:hypothetical protein